MKDIITELTQYIDENSLQYSAFIKKPSSLVGKQISHKFELSDSHQSIEWYNGLILGYDEVRKVHIVMYDDEEEAHCYFDLTLDLLNGDLKVQL